MLNCQFFPDCKKNLENYPQNHPDRKKTDLEKCKCQKYIKDNSSQEKTFAEFWEIYPRKKDKGNAIKAWTKIKEPEIVLEKIKTALKWQIKSIQWTKEEKQFIPYPASYLNGVCWEDEPDKVDAIIIEKKKCPHTEKDEDGTILECKKFSGHALPHDFIRKK
ncbi:MAG: hypothetical protein WC716_16585 [Chitinophagaceae bacterium]|jgi:hypothetical protein